jgi:hypothetical protein
MTIDPFKALVGVTTSINFEKTRERDGLAIAVKELQASLLRNDLWMPGDETFLADVLVGKFSAVQIAESICDVRRMACEGIAPTNFNSSTQP